MNDLAISGVGDIVSTDLREDEKGAQAKSN
jgi:hypothetical protein